MYFVDRSKIEQTLEYIDQLLKDFKQYSFESRLGQLGLERLSHMLIESIIDVGNMMIDGFIMRDPGSYDDIIDILVDEKVIPASDHASFQAVIRLRQGVIRNYLAIDHVLLMDTLMTHENKITQFSTYVRSYLESELGVAHAFSNE